MEFNFDKEYIYKMDSSTGHGDLTETEIVRCKDCKYSGGKNYLACSLRFGASWYEVNPDDFCSRGERRE